MCNRQLKQKADVTGKCGQMFRPVTHWHAYGSTTLMCLATWCFLIWGNVWASCKSKCERNIARQTNWFSYWWFLISVLFGLDYTAFFWLLLITLTFLFVEVQNTLCWYIFPLWKRVVSLFVTFCFLTERFFFFFLKKGYEKRVGTLYDAHAVSFRLCTWPTHTKQEIKKHPQLSSDQQTDITMILWNQDDRVLLYVTIYKLQHNIIIIFL